MKRRAFIAGLGTILGLGGSALGTGAFSETSADRELAVEIARDNDARLGLTELGQGGRSYEDGGEVALSLPSTSERLADPTLGLGGNSTYEFDRDVDELGATNPVMGLFRITNQGTQPVEVYGNDVASSDVTFELYDVGDPSKTALRDAPVTLTVGDAIAVGVRLRTGGAAVGNYQETLQIVAEAV